jgi:hypothetical protein
MRGDHTPYVFLQTPFREAWGVFSPDGRWVAYQSNESGRFEVYAQPFPGPGTKIPVSTNGGTQVRWRSDGQELFFLAPDDRIMSVPIRIASGTVFEAGTPRGLFPVHLNDTRAPGNFRQQYAVSRDGRSFLLNTLIEEQTNTPITLLLNRGGTSK